LCTSQVFFIFFKRIRVDLQAGRTYEPGLRTVLYKERPKERESANAGEIPAQVEVYQGTAGEDNQSLDKVDILGIL